MFLFMYLISWAICMIMALQNSLTLLLKVTIGPLSCMYQRNFSCLFLNPSVFLVPIFLKTSSYHKYSVFAILMIFQQNHIFVATSLFFKPSRIKDYCVFSILILITIPRNGLLTPTTAPIAFLQMHHSGIGRLHICLCPVCLYMILYFDRFPYLFQNIFYLFLCSINV